MSDILAKASVPADREDTSLPDIAPALHGNFYLSLVAICHQTSPRGRLPLEGFVHSIRLAGWDYLLAKFEQAAQADPHLLTPEHWRTISSQEVRQVFHDQHLGDRLVDSDGRAELLRDLGAKMLANDWTRADQMYEECEGHVTTTDRNLLRVLSQFAAYRDPVQKKSQFFLSIMKNSGNWTYPDSSLLGPPVDYHEVRGHLRIGTIHISDEELRQAVLTGQPVSGDGDIAIRRAVLDAIIYISEASEIRDPSRLHYLFWNVFRTVCIRDFPRCFSASDSSLPQRYRHLLQIGLPNSCPFSTCCQSTGQSHPILEHVFETDYY
ncbi:MAG: queuosine salvage family protein [Pseudomonadota bacterium]